MVEQTKKDHVVKALLSRQAIGVGVCIHESQLDSKLSRGESGLFEKFNERINQHAFLGSSELHLDRKVTGIAPPQIKNGSPVGGESAGT